MRKVLSLLIIPVLFIGCAKVKEAEMPVGQEGLHEVVFHAGWDPETRTELQEDGSVWWSPGDEISLFPGEGEGGGYKLTSTNTEPAAKVDFIGQIGEKPAESSYIAVFPYDDLNWISESIVHVTIPSEQVAKEGTFEKDLFVSIAVSDNENLYFKNICSGIKFSVSTPGIKKIEISSRGNTPISGNVFYDLETGVSSATSSLVTVNAPTESGFETGKYYYAVICPTSDPSGIDITYYTDDKFGIYSYVNPIEFKKGTFKRLYEKDDGILFHTLHETTAKISSYNFLPEDVDKTKITAVSFIVNSDRTTDMTIPSYSEEPVYFELSGTTATFYTNAEVFELEDASAMFFGWKSLKSLDLTNIETTFVTSMSMMFAGCNSLESITFGSFYTGNVENMDLMFGDCWSLESLDVSGFITNKVRDMSHMFAGCSSLKTLDLSSFDTSNVEDMRCMFGSAAISEHSSLNWIVGCSSIEFIDLHTFNTSKVKNMDGLFEYCSGLKSVNLSGWNTSNVENLGALFTDCISLENVDLSSFDTRNVTWMGHMFENCVSLKALDLSNFDTSKVTSMQNMFFNCTSLRSLNISSFNASSLTDIMLLLANTVELKKLDMGSIDLSKIEMRDDSFSSLAFRSKNVAIRCTDSTKQIIESLADGFYFNLDHVTWVGIDETIPNLPDIINPDMYCSEDFSMDKKVEVLQTASEGRGVDIVIMGDAYSDRLISDGTYESDMREAIDAIFDVEPMKSFRHLFNVYMVYAVSKNEVHDGSTVFSVYHELGNSSVCNAYTRVAVNNKPLSDVATIVIAHDTNAFPGAVLGDVWTAYVYSSEDFFDYGQAQQSIAFIGKWAGAEYTGTVVHEFGHLFAKLADEYVEKDEAIGTSDEYEVQNLIQLCLHTGAYKNIDLTCDLETIKWSRFINDPRYTNECLGAFEGGYLYSRGVWRPTEASIMGSVLWRHGYNSPSREAVYNRIHKLAYGEDWQYDYETFVQQDLKNIPQEPYFQSSPKYVPFPERVKQKHLFKMEESIAPDGRKMITVIMD